VQRCLIPALKIGAVVDTNGAGDAFVGGYLAAMLSPTNAGGDPLCFAKQGVHCAALVVQRHGCRLPPGGHARVGV